MAEQELRFNHKGVEIFYRFIDQNNGWIQIIVQENNRNFTVYKRTYTLMCELANKEEKVEIQ